MKCLVVEDDFDFFTIISEYLNKLNIEAYNAKSKEEALKIIEEKKFDLLIMDIDLEGKPVGLDLLNIFKKYIIDIIFITGYFKYKDKLLELYKDKIIEDYFFKPLDFTSFFHRLNILVEKFHLKEEKKENIYEKYGIIGKSFHIKKIIEDVEFVSKKEINVLIEGETGTGKELVARAIHSLSLRKNFIPLNCAAIPSELAEAELFGIKKGTATGVIEKRGKILGAHNGTLFLDEISSMPLFLQGKLLRAIEYKRFFPLGSDEEIYSNFRLISATNKNLEEEIILKNFRDDLYYRISSFKIFIPPLRERREDIPYLVKGIVKKFSEIYKEEKEITDEAIELLTSFEWKGNVRELQSFLNNVFLSSKSNLINSFEIFKNIKEPPPPPVYKKFPHSNFLLT